MEQTTLREFDRLYKEAKETALNRDEFLTMIFAAAVKLNSGEWTSPAR